ncbi:hypothetical protein LTR36_001429 [Oleoguttula mirabilis]|uniref:Uncharacterized protein n=1 Tax=Oleoguttula mirabilis TaxID=1507867 RepID=A0AAV9JPB1_9PEZI|nr:hypothetical protein LTR36_001429 [Oleoguttula mirabilis]
MTSNLLATDFNAFPIDKLVAGEGYVAGATCDLANDVHPLFARENMQGFDYDAILPALRLASHFLTTECLSSYWWAVLWGPYTENEDPDCLCKEYDMAHYSMRFEEDKLEPEEFADLQRDLRNLAKIVHYSVAELHACGRCARLEGVTIPADVLDPERCYGEPSEITIGNAIHDELMRVKQLADREGEATGMSEKLAERYLELAVSLVHETAHAAATARRGGFPPMPINDRKMAEDGYDWEESVFGGLPSIVLDGTMVLTEWPSPTLHASYAAKGGLWFCGKITDPISRYWRIPGSWTRQLFQTAFWRDVVPVKGSAALRPPKILGYRHFPQTCQCIVCRNIGPNGSRDEHGAMMEGSDEACSAAIVNYMGGPLCADDGDSYAGVPEGYVVLVDGSVVLERLQGLFEKPALLRRDVGAKAL